MSNIKQKLKTKSKEWLINQLVGLSINDPNVADRIMVSLLADNEDDSEFVFKFKSQLDKAVKQIIAHGPGTWKSQLPTAGFDSVADALSVMVPKNPQAVMEVCEYALVKLDGIFELQDECELEYLIDAFRELHLETCQKLKPDQRSLGKRLAQFGQQTEWGFFDGPPDGYSEVLGKAGLEAFCSSLAAQG